MEPCKHGGHERRVWNQIHFGTDEQTLEVRAVEPKDSHIVEAPILPDLFGPIPAGEAIGGVTAVGARVTHAVISSFRSANPWAAITAEALAKSEALRE